MIETEAFKGKSNVLGNRYVYIFFEKGHKIYVNIHQEIKNKLFIIAVTSVISK